MKLFIYNGQMEQYPTYLDMFKALANNGMHIEKLGNGTMTVVKDGQKVEAEYGELNSTNPIEPFKQDVMQFRDELRTSIGNLMEIGIKLPDDENNKLGRIFSFTNN